MMTFSKFIGTAAAAAFSVALALSATTVSQAADYRATPVDDYVPSDYWTVFHLGIHAGGGWADSDVDLAGFSPGFAAAVGAGSVPGSLDFSSSGFIGGIQAGASKQLNNIVIGVEADISFTDLDGSNVVFFPGVGFVLPTTTTATSSINWLSTVRARIGFLPSPALLLYATGGLAFADVDYRVSLIAIPIAGGNFNGTTGGTQTGWTLGGGAEWMFNPNWSIRAEALYFDLGEETVTITDPTAPGLFMNYDFDTTGVLARVAINYMFPISR